MNSTLLVVIAIAVIALIVIALVALMRRRTSLRQLPKGARVRYAESWQRIEMQFVDQPQEAVRAADQLVVQLVRERGGGDNHLPAAVGRARGAAGQSHGDSMTEALRRAMLDYRAAVQDLLGRDPRQVAPARTEISS